MFLNACIKAYRVNNENNPRQPFLCITAISLFTVMRMHKTPFFLSNSYYSPLSVAGMMWKEGTISPVAYTSDMSRMLQG